MKVTRLLATLFLCGIGYTAPKPVRYNYVHLKGSTNIFKQVMPHRFPLSIVLRNHFLPQIGNPNTPQLVIQTSSCSDAATNAAEGALPSAGGYIDARSCFGPFNAPTTIFFNKPTHWLIGPATILLSACPNINITASNATGSTIEGTGQAATVLASSSATCDMIDVNAQLFTLTNLDLSLSNTVARSTTPGTNCLIKFAAQQNLINHIRVIGPTVANGGDIFCHPSVNASAVTYRDVSLIGGATWADGWFLQASGPSTISQVTLSDVFAYNSTYTNQLIDADTFVDTLTIHNLQSGATSPFIIHAQNTLASQAPQFIHLDNSHLECGGIGAGVLLQLDSVNDFEAPDPNYFATCKNIAVIGAAASGTNIGGIGQHIGSDCIDILAGSGNTVIHNLLLVDCGQTGPTGTFDGINVAATTQGFNLDDIRFKSTTAIKPKIGVDIVAGATAFFQVSNVNGTSVAFGTSSCFNGATGNDQHVWNNPGSGCQDKITDTASVPAAFLQGIASSTFANLPTVPNGTVYGCSDCTSPSNPCTGASTGALAVRQNAAWVCK